MEGVPIGSFQAVPGTLTDLFILCGVPGYIRSDNGPEFKAQAVRDWMAAVGAKTAFVEPGPPWENGYCERFNARFYVDICLLFARQSQPYPDAPLARHLVNLDLLGELAPAVGIEPTTN